MFDLGKVKPIHVATYIVAAYIWGYARTHSKPTMKQRLAALQMLFD